MRSVPQNFASAQFIKKYFWKILGEKSVASSFEVECHFSASKIMRSAKEVCPLNYSKKLFKLMITHTAKANKITVCGQNNTGLSFTDIHFSRKVIRFFFLQCVTLM